MTVFENGQHVLEYSHLAEQAQVLKRAGDTQSRNLPGFLAGDALIVPVDIAAGGRNMTGDHIEQGSLARPIWSDQGRHFSAMQRQVDVAYGLKTAESFVQLVDTKQGGHARRSLTRVLTKPPGLNIINSTIAAP